jgi:ABC-type multidrug transport system ATPase subunit
MPHIEQAHKSYTDLMISGKTSLMNVLAARVPNGSSNFASLTGNVRVNDFNRDEAKFRVSIFINFEDYVYTTHTTTSAGNLCLRAPR